MSLKRFFISALIALCSSAQLFAIVQITESNYSSYNLTTSFVGYYAIANETDLYDFFENYSNNNAVLTNDIVVNSSVLVNGDLRSDYESANLKVWNPKNFSRIFDGNNHSISGLYCNTNSDNIGFIANCTGSVKNLTIKDSYFKGKNHVGGICGAVDNTATWNNQTFSNCYNYAKIVGNSNVGGIIGYGELNQYKQDNSSITLCANYGEIVGDNTIGGIIGYNNGDPTIEKCFNAGYISGTGDNIGGILGKVKTCSGGGPIKNCLNAGKITSSGKYIGGIAGYAGYAPISYCINVGLFLNDCKSTNWNNIVGYSENGPSNSYYDANNSNCTGGTKLTTAELCNGTLPSGFSTSIWKAGSNSYSDANVYPIDDEFAIKRTCVYPSIIGIGEPAYGGTSYYNVGTAESPDWKQCTFIRTIDDLKNVKNNLSGVYVQINDISESGNFDNKGNFLEEPTVKWSPIGSSSKQFTGKYYGRHRTISGIYVDGGNYCGLFSSIKNAVLDKIILTNGKIKGDTYLGSICGKADGDCKITDCYNYCNVSGWNYIGGICGFTFEESVRDEDYDWDTWDKLYNETSPEDFNGDMDKFMDFIFSLSEEEYNHSHDVGPTITGCYNQGEVNGHDYVAGICAYAFNAILEQCWNEGSITASYGEVGGICGGAGDVVAYCLNNGPITNTGVHSKGMIAGIGSTSHCLNISSIEQNETLDICSVSKVNSLGSTYWGYKESQIIDGKKYKYYPYLKRFGEDSARLGIVLNSYPIVYNFNGGTTTEEYATLYFETEGTSLPSNVTKNGCDFDGWYDNSNFMGNTITSISKNESGTKAFYAKWSPKLYSLTYETNGGEINSGFVENYIFDVLTLLPLDVLKNGYTFAGWYLDKNFSGSPITQISQGTFGNQKLYAKWTPKSYSVTLYANDGTITNGKDVKSYMFGTGATLPSKNEIARYGYDFAGWFDNSSYDGGAKTEIGENDFGNKNFWAKWTAKNYAVKLYINDGEINSGNLTNYTYDVVTILPQDVSKNGYSFAGWYNNEACEGTAITQITKGTTNDQEFWAKWTAKTYSVTLQTNNGTVNNGNVTSYTYGVGATLPTNVTRTGYTFAGWFDNSSYDGGAKTEIANNEIGDKNFWAKWTANNYKVTLDAQGGNINSNNVTSYTYGVGATLPTDVTKTGYIFISWKDSKENDVLEIPTDVFGDKSYTASWGKDTYTITYNANGGVINETYDATYQIEAEITLPTNVEKEGCTFDGWYNNANYTGSEITSIANNEVGNKNFWAKWTANEYNVTLDPQGGTIYGNIITKYTYGVVASLPTNVKRDGYTFTGWYTDKECTSAVASIISSTATGEQTFFAGWSNSAYAVTLNTNNGIVLEGNVTSYIHGTATTLPSSSQITKNGNTFDGWYDNASFIGTALTEIPDTAFGDIEFWAKWKVNSYNVIYNANGGTINGNVTSYVFGNGLQLPSDVTKTGYTFAGWFDNEELEEDAITSIPFDATGDKEFWAKWTANTYNIVLILNEGTIQDGMIENYVYGVGAALPTNVTKTGYAFDGWYINSNYDGAATTSIGVKEYGDKTYYAKWTPAIYAVNLKTNEGTVNAGNITSYTFGVAASLPTNVTKAGHKFAGWYDNELLKGEPITIIPNNANGAKTYYAKWDVQSYKVATNPNGGVIEDNDVTSYEYGTTTVLPTNVTRFGYEFAGWFDNPSLTGERILSINPSDIGDKSYFAKWSVHSFTVTLKTNGGTINSGNVVAYTYSNGATLPIDIVKAGSTFAGWYEDENFESDAVLTIPLDAYGDKTYYAKWTANEYAITYFVNQGSINQNYATTYTFGSSIELPDTLSREGYTFVGWYNNSNYDGAIIETIEANDFGDKFFYARWTVNSYKVVAESDKSMGNIEGAGMYNYKSYATLAAKADAGYEFVNWTGENIELFQGTMQDSLIQILVKDNITLTAHFKEKEVIYTIGSLVIDTLKTNQKIEPIDLTLLFAPSENGEISYSVSSSAPNIVLPQINGDKLYLTTFPYIGKADIMVTAKLTNGNKATLSANAVVEYDCNIQVEPTIKNVSCYGLEDGKIELSAEANYTYQWINSECTTNSLDSIAAGNYQVLITDENGCESYKTFTVSQPDEIIVSIDTVENPRCDKESRIILKADGDYTYLWSNGSTEKDLIGAEIGDYEVIVTEPTTGCSITLSQSLEMSIKQPEISLVTVSKESGKNLIVWVRENTDQIDYYTIYRERVADVYDSIATVPYSEISVFEDLAADPNEKSWAYKISATDVCGHETAMSELHRTIHLQKNNGAFASEINLEWNAYEGVDYNAFYIMRETTVSGYTFIDTLTTVSSYEKSYTDLVPAVGTSNYYIGIKLPGIVNPKDFLKAESGPFAIAISNIAEAENEEETAIGLLADSDVEVYSVDYTIYVKNAEGKNITIYDNNGRSLSHLNNAQNENEFTIRLDGIYFVKVDNESFKVIIQ